MTGKELRSLKRRELLKMLLVQCEETERVQGEADEIKKKFDVMSESYERLKKKLDIKDERLNQKDARITELMAELEKLKESGEAEILNVESMAEASLRLGKMFEEAEEAAADYLEKVRKLREGVKEKLSEQKRALPAAGNEKDWIPFKEGNFTGFREKPGTSKRGEFGELVSVDFSQKQTEKEPEENAPEEVGERIEILSTATAGDQDG